MPGLGPAFEGAIFCCAVSVVVDDGVAEDAVEPRNGRLFAAEGRCLFDGTNIGALDDVLGGDGRVDTFLYEVEESSSLGIRPAIGSVIVGPCKECGVKSCSTPRLWLVGCGTGAVDATKAYGAGALWAAWAGTGIDHFILLLVRFVCPNTHADG